MSKTVRALVVDDSALMRKLIIDILERDPDIQVIGSASNGAEALVKIADMEPDVVTMDIEMPVMDGLTALQHMMNDYPRPVVMISALGKRQADITTKALDLGAVDFIAKPSGTLSLDIDKLGDEIIRKVKMASGVKIRKRDSPSDIKPVPVPSFRPTKRKAIVIIGSSTGGPRAVQEVLSWMPRTIPAPILMVQHMPEGFTSSFAQRLNWCTSLDVSEARDGDPVRTGKALLAPANYHTLIENKRIILDDGPKVHYVRPSVDVLMKSAAKKYKSGCLGVLLTGMGSDGAEGMRAIKEAGGYTIAQNKETCVVYGMPKAAADLNVVDEMLPLEDIGKKILSVMGTL